MPKPAPERHGGLDSMSASNTSPTLAVALRFEDPPLGPRAALVRCSDGSEREGDLVGKTRERPIPAFPLGSRLAAVVAPGTR